MKPRRTLPLSAQLVLSSLAVLLLMLILMLLGSLHLIRESLLTQIQHQLDSQAPQLSAALATPLAQHDLATAQEIIDVIHAKGLYRYLVLFNADGHPVARAGQVATPLPDLDESLRDGLGDGVYDGRLDIRLAEQSYGQLRYGLGLDALAAARDRVIDIGGGIAVAAIFATWILLAVVGYYLTRRLTRLTEASRALAAGVFEVDLPGNSDDEVGQLARAFREMAQQLRHRLVEIRENEQRLYAIAHYTYDLELWIAADGRTVWVNPSVQRMTGYSPEECLAMADFPLCLIHPDDRDEAQWRLRDALRVPGESGEGYQFRMLRRDGDEFWASANWQPVHGESGQALGVRASIRDITDLKRIEESMLLSLRQLKISETSARTYLESAEQERARLMALLSAMNLGILFITEDQRIVYHNPAFLRIWRLPEGHDLVGRPATSAFAQAESLPRRMEDFAAHLREVLGTPETGDSHEIALNDGRILTQLHHPVRDKAGHFIGYLWIYEDVTQERQTAEQLLYLAERDSLTGLYNRHRFHDELNRAIAEASRHHATCALLFFDLDEFKAINDHFGHAAGDALLIRVASEAAGTVRRHESLFRLGGDEFAVIMPFANPSEAQALAERLVRAIAQIPFQFETRTLRISSSLGIALYPEHASDGEQLVAHADSAMYQAKQAGKNAWRVYRPELDQTPGMMQRLSWNERINHALAHDLFELHFQGVYRIGEETPAHLEVLIRLRDPASGELIPPGEFIPIAEASPKIVEIDRWVLRHAIARLARQPAIPPLAVNLSGRSFDDIEMPEFILGLLREHGVEPRRLLIEITETAAVSDLTDAQRFIEALKRGGCQVCLDDFGAGFASFAYLKHIGVDIIKIDGMFIQNLPNDHDNQVFMRGMLEVARGLGKRTIAECVEDAATLDLLARLGVEMVQGWHLDRPRRDHPAIASA